MSAYYLEHASVDHIKKHFDFFEAESRSLLDLGLAIPAYGFLYPFTFIMYYMFPGNQRQSLALCFNYMSVLQCVRYDQLLKTSHAFNTLDSRGFVGVTERARYFGRMRRCSSLSSFV